ncbi:GDP-mannose transporter into the lumen of the Golgi [Malassezia vespertilionis]|uniref:GDP-mannose transporter into the lumen of the Golgi n=1 Tax=Malassezia vespertilionis TaxID=2020962 RepID=UPI0024B1EDF6|nr:GDP-mannose transporter into the lumen of the Golgi [Malassezia vespertilionis]WFD08343.1 GDP-mannose transporter into the lumen of the Golgi [Malassezia vespertilionis]
MPASDEEIEFGSLGDRAGTSELEADAVQERLLGEGPGTPTSEAPQHYGSAVAPVLSYCMASISMTVINKFTVSGAGFTMNLLVLLCQCAVGILMVYAAKMLGYIQLRDLNMRDVKAWFPISTMLVFVIWTGSKALQFMDIPIYTIFKNLTIILIAYGEVLWFDGHITRLVFISFLLMVLSSFVAAWPDIVGGEPAAVVPHARALATAQAAQAAAPAAQGWALGQNGYLWMLTNCLVSAVFVLVMRKRIKLTGFKDWDTMFYNNLLSIPVLLVMSLLLENWSAETLERNFPHQRRGSLILAVALSGTGGVAISYTTAWCIRTTSSTTYSMVGALNKLPLALSGMVFFGNRATIYNSLGIAIGFLAGIVYAVGKNKQAEAARLANTAATGTATVHAAGGGHGSDPKGVIPTHTRAHVRND